MRRGGLTASITPKCTSEDACGFELTRHTALHSRRPQTAPREYHSALIGNDFEIGEISAYGAAAPEADQPFLAVAQLSDD